jgi:hypothetical protein
MIPEHESTPCSVCGGRLEVAYLEIKRRSKAPVRKVVEQILNLKEGTASLTLECQHVVDIELDDEDNEETEYAEISCLKCWRVASQE